MKQRRITDATNKRPAAKSRSGLQRYASRIAALRRSRKLIRWRDEPAFAKQLKQTLAILDGIDCDPVTGLDLVERFYHCDTVIFNRCGTSGGRIRNVYRISARNLWVHFAAQFEDKDALIERLLVLLAKDDFDVRDHVVGKCDQYLSNQEGHFLAERFSALSELATNWFELHRWLGLVTIVARAIVDPVLHEKALLAQTGGKVGLVNLSIARLYLQSGSPTGALRWLRSAPDDIPFRQVERDELLFEAYGQASCVKSQIEVAQRMFDRSRCAEDLDRLVGVLGEEHRARLVVQRIQEIHYSDFSVEAALFLLAVDRYEDAEYFIVKHRARLDRNDHSKLLEIAKLLEPRGRLLGATCLYRALMEWTLNRASSRYDSHAVRYWKKLESLAQRIEDWGDLEPAGSYRVHIRQQHKRKTAFWPKIDAVTLRAQWEPEP